MFAHPAVASSWTKTIARLRSGPLGRRIHNLGELALLRTPAAASARHAHAIVLGGSWTGMLAAAVLAQYFERVTVVERDDAAETLRAKAGQTRRGVPHGAQSHIVLSYAVRFVNALLPGFEASLQAQGAKVGDDMGLNFGWHHRGHWRLRQRLDMPMWFASRALIEWTLRHEVLAAFPNISIACHTNVTGFAAGKSGRLAGVHVQRGQAHEAALMRADFVADCTGKQSHAPAWLAALGFTPVHETQVDAKTFYATCRLRRTDHAVRDEGQWANTLHGTPDAERGGHFAGAITVENGDVCVWAVRAGFKPPADTEAFTGFLSQLDVPDFYKQVTDTQQTEPANRNNVRVFGAGPARRRAYDKAAKLPHNFVALGDAACSTDPAFGLGLSLAASTVACLAAALHARGQKARRGQPWQMDGLGHELANRVAWRTYLPWLLTAAEDYRFPHTRGPHRGHWWVSAMQRYVDQAFTVAHRDAEVDAMVLRVVGLVAHPLQVFGPLVFGRVLQESWRSRRAMQSHRTFLEVNDERSIEANVGSR